LATDLRLRIEELEAVLTPFILEENLKVFSRECVAAQRLGDHIVVQRKATVTLEQIDDRQRPAGVEVGVGNEDRLDELRRRLAQLLGRGADKLVAIASAHRRAGGL
jgi:hypothetical protein